jgi:predicted tellurium resistance membrane protein TerC
LAFVGLKMILADYFPISNWISLAVILLVLGVTIIASLIATNRKMTPEAGK